MRNDADFEALVRAALDRSGQPAPFPVDVSHRVMARVAELGPAPRADVGRRELVRFALAAALAGIALIGALVWRGPSLGDVVGHLGRATADTAGAAADLTASTGTLLDGLARAAVAMGAAARAVVRPLGPLQPYAQAMLTAVAVLMIATAGFVVARDLRSPISDKEQA